MYILQNKNYIINCKNIKSAAYKVGDHEYIKNEHDAILALEAWGICVYDADENLDFSDYIKAKNIKEFLKL